MHCLGFLRNGALNGKCSNIMHVVYRGEEFDRKVWKVPPDFDRGAYPVVERHADRVVFARDMAITNYAGTAFRVKVRREVGYRSDLYD